MRAPPPSSPLLGNTVTTDKTTTMDHYNKHFSTAGHAFHLAIPTLANCSAPLPSFSFTQIQTAHVLKELQNQDPYKSAGLDNLEPLFLKLSTANDATPINRLFKLSFVSSEIPKDWKASAVIPHFEGGCCSTKHSRPKLLPTYIHPAFLKSSKAKLTNRSLTISNTTVPSPLCNLVSEPVTVAPQPRSRY